MCLRTFHFLACGHGERVHVRCAAVREEERRAAGRCCGLFPRLPDKRVCQEQEVVNVPGVCPLCAGSEVHRQRELRAVWESYGAREQAAAARGGGGGAGKGPSAAASAAGYRAAEQRDEGSGRREEERVYYYSRSGASSAASAASPVPDNTQRGRQNSRRAEGREHHRRHAESGDGAPSKKSAQEGFALVDVLGGKYRVEKWRPETGPPVHIGRAQAIELQAVPRRHASQTGRPSRSQSEISRRRQTGMPRYRSESQGAGPSGSRSEQRGQEDNKRERRKAWFQFDRDFPHGYDVLHTEGTGLICGIQAIVSSFQSRELTLMTAGPTEADLLDIVRHGKTAEISKATGREEDFDRTFTDDQLAEVLRAWGRYRGLKLRLGVMVAGVGPHLHGFEESNDAATSATIWIYHNGRADRLAHYSGMTRAAALVGQEETTAGAPHEGGSSAGGAQPAHVSRFREHLAFDEVSLASQEGGGNAAQVSPLSSKHDLSLGQHHED